MEKPMKRLRLDELTVESFVTSNANMPRTIWGQGFTEVFTCTACNDKTTNDDFTLNCATNFVPGCQGPDAPTYPEWPTCKSCICETVSCYICPEFSDPPNVCV